VIIVNASEQLPQGSTVAAIGTFDGVHLGHVTLAEFVKNQARDHDKRSLLITFDSHPQTVLRPRNPVPLLQSFQVREQLLGSLGIDMLAPLHFTRELSLLNASQFMQLMRDRYGVGILVMGYNNRFGHDQPTSFADYRRMGEALGITVEKAPEYLGKYAPVSSTIIRRLIASGKVDDAMHCMDRPFSLYGRVVHGYAIGRELGFPTANVGELDPALIVPHSGAYAVLVNVAGQRLRGMANIGTRPTIDDGKAQSIEVNLFDFDGNIYGEEIELQFIKFLRLEQKMSDAEALKEQLTRDRERSQAVLNEYLQSIER